MTGEPVGLLANIKTGMVLKDFEVVTTSIRVAAKREKLRGINVNVLIGFCINCLSVYRPKG